MKKNEIKRGRYVAKVNGKLTIVSAFRNGTGWTFRCERSHRFVRLTARRLWRVAMSTEQWNDDSVQQYNYHEHLHGDWLGEFTSIKIPVGMIVQQPSQSECTNATYDDGVAGAMYALAIQELSTAGC